MEEKLKPCPFCGEKEELAYAEDLDDDGDDCFYVECDNCKVRGQYKETKQEAIAAWSTRAKVMRKIVDYYFACSTFNLPNSHINSIEAKVKKLIKKGWELYGNPFEASGHLCQAMVKYEEEKEQEPKIDRLQEFLNKDIGEIIDELLKFSKQDDKK